MNLNRDELIRREILLQLHTLNPMPRSAEQIAREAARQGDDFSAKEIGAQMQFLADDGLLIEIPASGSGTTSKLFRIHANGIRHWQQHFAK